MADAPLDSPFFLDLFRRADQNDNQELSLAEFLAFFRDGVMSSEELTDLFNEIDSGKNGTIEIDELTAYFQGHSVAFRSIFDALSVVNSAATGCLGATFPASTDEKENFVTRFFMREVSRAIQSIQTPIDDAHDSMVTAALSRRPEVYPMQDIQPVQNVRQPSNHSYPSHADDSAMEEQVTRLASLVDRLAGKANFGAFEQVKGDGDYSVLASYEMTIMDGQAGQLQQELGRYTAGLRFAADCVKCQTLYEDDTVTLYEVWRDQAALDAHMQSDHYRGFQRALVDCLQKPLSFSSMVTPTSWW